MLQSLHSHSLILASGNFGIPGEVLLGVGIEIRPPCGGHFGMRPITKPGDADHLGISYVARHRNEKIDTIIHGPSILALGHEHPCGVSTSCREPALDTW